MRRVWELHVSPWKKFLDPAGIWTQDIVNTSRTLLPLSHFDPWAETVDFFPLSQHNLMIMILLSSTDQASEIVHVILSP